MLRQDSGSTAHERARSGATTARSAIDDELRRHLSGAVPNGKTRVMGQSSASRPRKFIIESDATTVGAASSFRRLLGVTKPARSGIEEACSHDTRVAIEAKPEGATGSRTSHPIQLVRSDHATRADRDAQAPRSVAPQSSTSTLPEAFRVQERDPGAVCAGTRWRFVDEPRAGMPSRSPAGRRCPRPRSDTVRPGPRVSRNLATVCSGLQRLQSSNVTNRRCRNTHAEPRRRNLPRRRVAGVPRLYHGRERVGVQHCDRDVVSAVNFGASTCPRRCTPNTPRITSQTSPSVARAGERGGSTGTRLAALRVAPSATSAHVPASRDAPVGEECRALSLLDPAGPA